MKNKRIMAIIPSTISHSNPGQEDLVSHQKFLLSWNPMSSSRFIVITAQVPRPVKYPCGHHGLLGHNTEEAGVVPRVKAVLGNWGSQSLQRGGGRWQQSHTPSTPQLPQPHFYWNPTCFGPRQPTLCCAHTAPSAWKALPFTAYVVSTYPPVTPGLLSLCHKTGCSVLHACLERQRMRKRGWGKEGKVQSRGKEWGGRKDKAIIP